MIGPLLLVQQKFLLILQNILHIKIHKLKSKVFHSMKHYSYKQVSLAFSNWQSWAEFSYFFFHFFNRKTGEGEWTELNMITQGIPVCSKVYLRCSDPVRAVTYLRVIWRMSEFLIFSIFTSNLSITNNKKRYIKMILNEFFFETLQREYTHYCASLIL